MSTKPFVIYVTYQGTPDSKFDRNYYVKHHVPLVTESWQRYGLLSAQAFFPAHEQAGTIVICECVFRDEAAMQAAFSSPEAPAVIADVSNFTDITPEQVRVVPL